MIQRRARNIITLLPYAFVAGILFDLGRRLGLWLGWL